MKTAIRLICVLTSLMLVFMLAGCGSNGNSGPAEINIPSTGPTSEPVPIDPSLTDAFLGDWYGLYKVASAGGVYAGNADVRNDCAMRVALDNCGQGVCYLVVNGLGADAISGSANVFALCTASTDGEALTVKGMINRLSVDWSFKKSERNIVLTERYGTDEDFMDIEITLSRPDMIAVSGLRIDALMYAAANGFFGIVDKLGGSSAELPALTAAEGYQTHDFFTQEVSGEVVPGNTVSSVDGRIVIRLPEKYMVLQNDGAGLTVASPDTNVWSVDFTIAEYAGDSLNFLLTCAPDASDFFHYEIDGFDFYGAFVTSQTPISGQSFRLCGSNGSGAVVVIDLILGMTEKDARNYVSDSSSAFVELVLGAMFNM